MWMPGRALLPNQPPAEEVDVEVSLGPSGCREQFPSNQPDTELLSCESSQPPDNRKISLIKAWA